MLARTVFKIDRNYTILYFFRKVMIITWTNQMSTKGVGDLIRDPLRQANCMRSCQIRRLRFRATQRCAGVGKVDLTKSRTRSYQRAHVLLVLCSPQFFSFEKGCLKEIAPK